jgi:hypothetical protein
MIGQGKWIEQSDYNTYPQEKWCDYDYMAAWIRSQKYEPKTTMENLIDMILAYYEDDEKYRENGYGYYKIKDKRKYPDNLMINIEDVSCYVSDNGGLKEFDYYI